jgi:YHS domain-containing protein
MNCRPQALLNLFSAAVLVTTAIVSSGAAVAAEPDIYSHKGLAIRGYDPVAYHQGGPKEGKEAFRHSWMGATWQFSSAANRDLFAANPEKYAPEYGGYCAYAVSQDSTASIDPDTWTLVDGKLYLNYSKRIEAKWLKKRDAYIVDADKNWPDVLK